MLKNVLYNAKTQKEKTLLHFMVKKCWKWTKNDYFTMYKLKSDLCSLRDTVY